MINNKNYFNRLPSHPWWKVLLNNFTFYVDFEFVSQFTLYNILLNLASISHFSCKAAKHENIFLKWLQRLIALLSALRNFFFVENFWKLKLKFAWLTNCQLLKSFYPSSRVDWTWISEKSNLENKEYDFLNLENKSRSWKILNLENSK